MCQLKCPLCETPKRKKNPGVLGWGCISFEKFKEFIDLNPLIQEVELSWYGEIFLNPDMGKIIKYAFEKGVLLKAMGGVNFNNVSEEVLHDCVRYKFKSMIIAIDGITQKTYAEYRRGARLKNVIHNIMTINKYKKQYNSSSPVLYWQFIIFGHNEKEIPFAMGLARKLGMFFFTKLSGDENFSPIKNKKFVADIIGEDCLTRQDYADRHGKHYMNKVCWQLWEEPVINWNGDLFGCSKNTFVSFGNVFESGLETVLNSEKYGHVKQMLMGKKPARDDIVCTQCPVFRNRKGSLQWRGDSKK